MKNIKKQIKSLIRLLRLNICLLTILGVVVGYLIVSDFSHIYSLFLALIAAFTISGAGNVINDYFDYESDKINSPERPLPSGDVSKPLALIFWLLLNLVGFFSASLVSTPFLVIASINILVAFVYSWKLQHFPVIGNLADTYLAAIPFIAGGLIVYNFSFILNSPVLVLFVIVFLGNWSREILKDIEDIEGDKKSGSRTMPILIGKRKSLIVSRTILVLASVLLLYPFYSAVFGLSYLYLLFPALLLISLTFFQSVEGGQRSLKIVMFIIMGAFLIGALV